MNKNEDIEKLKINIINIKNIKKIIEKHEW